MNKKIMIWFIGLFLLVGVLASVSFSSPRSTTIIDINSTQRDILNERNLTNPTISDLVCDGKSCRSCAKKDNYRMGCIKINQKYCSSYNQTCIDNPENDCENICFVWTDYNSEELESIEATAYKTRWEGIADVIIEREGMIREIVLDEGEVEVRSIR